MIRIATYRNFVGELSVTYKRTDLATVRILTSKDATHFMHKYFDDIMDDHEEVKVLHLNQNNCVVNVHHAATGSDDMCLIPIKEIVRQAIFIKTSAIILFHNHPSGNLNASNEDIRVSKLLKEACSLLDISMLDSIILTRESYTSLKDNHLM